jgi:replicative DNA helicase
MKVVTDANSEFKWHEVGPLLTEVVDDVDRLYHAPAWPAVVVGIPTGLSDIDRFTGGMQPGLTIIAGRPSMGSTALAIGVAGHVAFDYGLPVAYVSPREKAKRIMLRMVCAVGGVDCDRMRTGRLTDDCWPRVTAGVQKIAEGQFFVDDDVASVAELRKRVVRLSRQCGKLGLVVVDAAYAFADAKQAEVLAALKAVAKEIDVPVLAIAHLNRSLEGRQDKRPLMSDLRETLGDDINADAVWFLYRDSAYNPDGPDAGTAEIIIAKSQGPIGPVRVNFNSSELRFSDYVPVESSPAEVVAADMPHFDELPVTEPAKKTARKRAPTKKKSSRTAPV